MTNTPKIDLTLPDFLRVKRNTSPKRKPRATPWHMPKKKESRKERRQRKEDHDKMVVAAVKNGAYTFHRIRKELDDAIAGNEISNALRRSIKARAIRKDGRRYYPF